MLRGLTGGILALAVLAGAVPLPAAASFGERPVVCRMACADQDACCCKARHAASNDTDADHPSIGAEVSRCPEGCSLPAGPSRTAGRSTTADRFETNHEVPRSAASIHAGESTDSFTAAGAADPRAPPLAQSLR